MTEEEKQELEALRQEKRQRIQTQRAEAALAQSGVRGHSLPCWRALTTAPPTRRPGSSVPPIKAP